MKMFHNKLRISILLLISITSYAHLSAVWPFTSNNHLGVLENAALGVKNIAEKGITISPDTRKTLDSFSQAIKDASKTLDKGMALSPESIASLNKAAQAINSMVKDGVRVEPETITMFNTLSNAINLLIKDGVTIAPETLNTISSLDASLKYAVQNGIKTTITPDIAGFTKVVKIAGVGASGFSLTCLGARLIYNNQHVYGVATMIGGMAMLLSCDKIVDKVS